MIDAFIENTNRAKNKEEVYKLFEESALALGFDRVLYAYVSDQPKLNQKSEIDIVTSYPKEWMDYYHASNFFAHDPVVAEMNKTNGPFTWDGLSKGKDLTKLEPRILNEAKEIKINSGISIGIHFGFGEVAGVSVANTHNLSKPDLNIMRKLYILSMQFHQVFSDHNQGEIPSKIKSLTKREVEILHWIAEGKSDQSIADILMVQHSTIRYHMGNIFNKLEVNDRTLAVIKAIKYQLISPSYINSPIRVDR